MVAKDLYQYIVPDTSGVPLAPRIRTSGVINERTVANAYNTWLTQSKRFRMLYLAYVGVTKNLLISDVNGTEEEKQTASNFCNYIVTTLEGYIAGNPPEYEYSQDDTYAKQIVDLFREQNKEMVDSDLIQDMTIYGRAFELVYRSDDELMTPKSTVISPQNCFVAYSGDVEEDSVFGAIFYEDPAEDGTTEKRIHLYTVDEVQIWRAYVVEDVLSWKLESSKPHGFGRVPLIEYRNNKTFMGDFETIMTLQNIYNRTLLNRVADVDAFAKSILLLIGSVLGQTPDEVEESVKNLNDKRVLQMDNDGSSASYLERTMDQAGVQVLQDMIKNDIHKFSFVPDLSDEQFSNNASGIAMAYKTFGTDQLVARKALNFQKGYRRRCKLYDTALFNPLGGADYKPMANLGAMHIKFKFNTPQDLTYLTSAVVQLVQTGILSKDTARRVIDIIGDADAEKEKVQSEQDEQAERNRLEFEDDYSTTPDNADRNPFIKKPSDLDEGDDDDLDEDDA